MGNYYSYNTSYNGTGYLYFIHPISFTIPIQQIKDPNGFKIHDSSSLTYSIFTSSIIPAPSPYTGSYRVWRTLTPVSYTGPGEFEFIF